VLAVDTNVLVYAADEDAEAHAACRQHLNQWRVDPTPTFLTWNVCYEFLRVSTHPQVLRAPWHPSDAWRFLGVLLDSPGFALLRPTERHQAVLSQTLSELPDVRGNLMHDLHTAVVMREHGVSRICTRDTHFHRFPFLEVVDPLR